MARVDDAKSKTQKEFFQARCRIAMGEANKVMKEIPEGVTQLELKAVRLFSKALADNNSNNDSSHLAALKTMVDQDATGNEGLRLVTGVAFNRAGDYNEALRALHGAKDSLEALHLSAAIFIGVERLDAAKRTLEKMQDLDEDATLTQLTSAWVALASGGENGLREAVYVLNDLIGKWNSTPLLAGALSCALNAQGKFAEAEKAMAGCSNPNHPSVLRNRIVALLHENKAPNEVINALRSVDPAADFFRDTERLSKSFDECAAKTF